MRAGTAPTEGAAVSLAEEARLHIDRWFYPCSPQMHASLAETYTSDERFGAHYDEQMDGLAEYVAQAIRANAAIPGEED